MTFPCVIFIANRVTHLELSAGVKPAWGLARLAGIEPATYGLEVYSVTPPQTLMCRGLQRFLV